jgi:N-acetylglucosamine-6-phosphate deacetylase
VAKSVHDDVLDGALNIIKNNCTRMVACSTQPTTYTEGNATFALADVTMASGDFTAANGDTSGRKLTIAAKSSVTVDTSGTFQHVALLDVTNSKLLYVTTGTSQALTSGNTINFPAWDIEIADPA